MADIFGQVGAPRWMAPEERSKILADTGTELAQGFTSGFSQAWGQAGGKGPMAPQPDAGLVDQFGKTANKPAAPAAAGANPWDLDLEDLRRMLLGK